MQTLESEAPSSSSAQGGDIPKLRGLHPCKECQRNRRTKDFRLDDWRKMPYSERCKDCEFPDCHCCGRNQSTAKRIENRKPVSEKDKTELPDGTRVWFCNRKQCQSAKKNPTGELECTVCGVKKPRADFGKKKSQNLKDVCPSCEFPTCQQCGTNMIRRCLLEAIHANVGMVRGIVPNQLAAKHWKTLGGSKRNES